MAREPNRFPCHVFILTRNIFKILYLYWYFSDSSLFCSLFFSMRVVRYFDIIASCIQLVNFLAFAAEHVVISVFSPNFHKTKRLRMQHFFFHKIDNLFDIHAKLACHYVIMSIVP